MAAAPRKRFYWIEFVSRREVETALESNRYPFLYQRWMRRALVLLYVAFLMLLANSQALGELATRLVAEGYAFLSLLVGVSSLKIGSYTEGLFFLALLLLLWPLRSSVRMIADAPTELLDERLVALRDRCYVIAYRALLLVLGGYFGLALATQPTLTHDTLLAPVLFFCMLGASLPSLILAWQLPSEA
jgi:hypothetical protein